MTKDSSNTMMVSGLMAYQSSCVTDAKLSICKNCRTTI